VGEAKQDVIPPICIKAHQLGVGAEELHAEIDRLAGVSIL
jgi:hypothetical protein